MPKQKITIHLDSEIAEKLRLQSIEKYHNSRSMSKLIEDMASGDTGLTPEEDAVLDRADNEPPEGAPTCDPWADVWICKQCWGGAFESFKFIHRPVFCPLCGAKNTLVRTHDAPDWMARSEHAKRVTR
jgi:rubrerythrin